MPMAGTRPIAATHQPPRRHVSPSLRGMRRLPLITPRAHNPALDRHRDFYQVMGRTPLARPQRFAEQGPRPRRAPPVIADQFSTLENQAMQIRSA
jgi:hypothetical protein